MKEAILSIKDGEGNADQKVKVKLDDENIIIEKLPNRQFAITSTSIDSPRSTTSGSSIPRQATASLSSTESSQTGSQKQSTKGSNSLSSMPADDSRSGERVVTIKRQPGGGLGISVKGGAEHGIPVLISRVFPGQAADQTHLLHPGDAILAVNNKKVEHMMHDDVVGELRSCGPQVALTVCTFDGASHVLRPAASASTATPSETSQHPDQPLPQTNNVNSTESTASSKGQDAHAGSVTTAQLDESTQLDNSMIPSMEKETKIPLLFARIEIYHPGTDKRRQNCFEVIGQNKASTGVILCENSDQANDWVSAISAAINKATMKKMEQINEQKQPHITYMGWVSERYAMPASSVQTWYSRFIALRGGKLYVFERPPERDAEWQECGRVYKMHESLCRVHVPPRQLLDQREHCFSVQYSTSPPVYCSLQSKADLLRWEESVQKATHSAVYAAQSQSYECSFEDKPCTFVVHFNSGFKLVEVATQVVLWAYKFSQLKASSDDGHSLITFSFHNRESDLIDKQSFHCQRAYPLLFCVHAFLAAKLSLVDPTFLEKINAQNAATDVTSAMVNGSGPRDSS
ncbi:gamma-1-syntrophin-like [Clavelina lepadiformis]|uniref:Syntrophin n=1 Tax=Clavelina lepadiformis TaxID=159417 RepID=A0ABP0FYB8_CLALP